MRVLYTASMENHKGWTLEASTRNLVSDDFDIKQKNYFRTIFTKPSDNPFENH